MNSLLISNKSGKLFYVLAIFMGSLLMVSCGTTAHFNHSTVVPGADGKVKVKNDKNGNHQISIDIKNLATPDRLQPAKKVYVVWMESAQRSAQNLGQLKISKKLKGYLQTSSPFKPTTIFITAEDQPNIDYPGSQVVLKTSAF